MNNIQMTSKPPYSDANLSIPSPSFKSNPWSIFFSNQKSKNQKLLSKMLLEFKNHCEWVHLKLIQEDTYILSVQNEKPEPIKISQDHGVMVEVFEKGHFGYCGTSDVTELGLLQAFNKAKKLAQQALQYKIFSFDLDQVRPANKGYYQSLTFQKFDSLDFEQLMSLLIKCSKNLKVGPNIVSNYAGARLTESHQFMISSHGMEIQQDFYLVGRVLMATAQNENDTQTRTDGGYLTKCIQSGLEWIDEAEWLKTSTQIGKDALDLLRAPNCPNEKMDLLVSPDQMYIQIHESIGHPLELDRILGDERNYAGWSFVKPNDFGHLKYGSDILNVTFDPTMVGQYASYNFDECGNPAKKEFLIKDGLLVRGLGSLESQMRLKVPGVANFRSQSWNRAPIDRMANINVEPGDKTFKDLVSMVENGILVSSNRSWSIDDYRRKFQFGCEMGYLIKDGELKNLVKNPNYHGISVNFWNQLKALGNAETVEMYGTPYCGKGEANQIIRVGHASPYALFSNIEIFGGIK